MLHVGLTGGLASGKSTVARRLAELGAVIVDADQLAREVVEPGTPGLSAVIEAFGADLLRQDSSLDRVALAQVVFGDDAARARLNAIVHPLVREATAARVAGMPDRTIVVHDVPLIVENGMGSQYHLVVVVAAPEALRLERAVARGLTEDAARARIAAQADDDARRAAADVWLPNESDETDLRSAVENLWRTRLAPFAENLHERRPAVPAETPAPAGAHDTHQARAERLVARVRRAAGETLADVHASPSEDVALVELRATAGRTRPGPDSLLAAGFVADGDGRYANADPGLPAHLLVAEDPDR